MKNILFTLTLLAGAASQGFAASSVNVIIDGQNFSCSQGGSGGGNQCECAIVPSGNQFTWTAYKRGERVDWNYAKSREEGEAACRQFILSNSKCYQ